MERLMQKPRRGGTMIRITVQYDRVTQTFKLVGLNFETLAEGDALFDLNLPLISEEAESADEFAMIGNAFVAHA
jgi:hypothetical protein